MPASYDFIKRLEHTLRSFNPQDPSQIYRMFDLLLIMHNMGWWKKFGWFLNEILKLTKQHWEEFPERVKRDITFAKHYFLIGYYLIGRMDSRRAFQHLKKLEKVSTPYLIASARRLFYLYLGHHPLAYKYVQLGKKLAKENTVLMWEDCRRAFFLMCGGKDPRKYGIDPAECGKEYANAYPAVEETPEMTFLVRTHIRAFAILMGFLPLTTESLQDLMRGVKLGFDKNYDHVTLRILRALVPLLNADPFTRHFAGRMLRAAKHTSKTEGSRYMYEWFELYEMAFKGEAPNIERKIRFYESRKFIAHEILARLIAAHLGINPDRNLSEAKAKAQRYWQRCVLRIGDLLFAPIQ
ncbi:MAG: hypothetical protein GXO39_06920 [Thermotogae bacterium]|nr:hypothetical protein [Thermotogota bacterium]